MSFGVRIIPTTSKRFTWGDLKGIWGELVFPYKDELLGKESQIRDSENQENIKDGQLLGERLHDILDGSQVYEFQLEVPSAILLFINITNLSAFDEKETIEHYGINKDSDFIEDLWRAWQACGIFYSVKSYVGQRTKYEAKLLFTLVLAIANLCEGYILIYERHPFDLPVGIYSSEEFSHAKLRISDEWLGFDN